MGEKLNIKRLKEENRRTELILLKERQDSDIIIQREKLENDYFMRNKEMEEMRRDREEFKNIIKLYTQKSK